MIAFQLIIILLLIFCLRLFLVQKSILFTERILAISFFLLLLVLVLFPGITDILAETLNVRRGADLVFYLAHFLLFLVIIVLFRRIREQQLQLTILVRQLAILTAHDPNQKAELKAMESGGDQGACVESSAS